jgi:hypothetical protein
MTRTSRARIRPFTRICGCRLNQSSWPAKREVNRVAVFISPHLFRAPSLTHEHFCLTAAADIAVTGPRFFASRLEDVGNIAFEARLICQGLRLLLVLVLERKNRFDHEQEHEHDYDEGGAPKCAACES